MCESGDEDLPDLAIGGRISVEPYTVTKINVDAEIYQNLQRKELKKQIELKKIEFEEDIALPEIPPTPKSTICAFPPTRKFLHPERSLRSFNFNSLTTQNLCPSQYDTCTAENAEQFFSWFRSKIKNLGDDLKRRFFQFLWLLMSCHPDQHIVQKCRDILIEHSSAWRLKYEEVLIVFYNWGASPGDFVTDLDLNSISASLDSRPLVSSANLENALQVLHCQLEFHSLEGSQCCLKSVFILLTLLTLDENFYCCLSEVHACLEQLAHYAKTENHQWVEEYCEALLQVESHHARVAFLIECVVPEYMRWCLCLAHCQHTFSLEKTFDAKPEPLLLQAILADNFDTFINLDSWELYSLISIVDTGISQVISCETDEEIKKGFLDWLNVYMERKIERRTQDIDIDATLIVQLVSRLQVEWESAWQQDSSATNLVKEEANLGAAETEVESSQDM